ncbi:MAG: GGDEF domain-containing protein [Pseudomonadota bacterium]
MTELGKRLHRGYQTMLFLLALGACAAFWLDRNIDSRERALDEIVLIAADQKLIVQRVSMMVMMLARPDPYVGASRLRRDIAEDLRVLGANHAELRKAAGLIDGPDGSVVVPGDRPARTITAPPHRLDDRLNQFVERTRRVLAAPLGPVDLTLVAPIADTARTELPDALRGTMNAFKAETASIIRRSRFIKLGILGGFVLLLFGMSTAIFRPMVRAVEEKTADLETARKRMEHTALHDELTSLPNRRYLSDYLSKTIARAQRHREVTAVLHLDLDRFKQINDTLGHAAGDAVLLEATKRMQGSIREADFLARIGGDEFIIIAAEVHSVDGLSRLADRIIERLMRPIDYNGVKCHVGVSIGIALAPPDSDVPPERLIMNADAALYAAKDAGRGCHRFFGDDAAIPFAAITAQPRRQSTSLRAAS